MRSPWPLLLILGCTANKTPCKDGYVKGDAGNCVPVHPADSGTGPVVTDSGGSDDSGSDISTDTNPPIDPGDSGDSAVPAGIVIANCDEPLGGIDWTVTPPDARGGFEDELAAMDLTTLPEQIEIAHMDSKERGWVAYAMMISATEMGDTIDRDTAIASGIMGQVMIASILKGDGDMDVTFFRRGLLRYYICSRGYPETLDGFKEMFGYPSEFIEVDSIVKCRPRLKGEDFETGVFVAQALVDGEYGETEILMTGRRSDGALDFAVYGPDGKLTNRAPFPVTPGRDDNVKPAPFHCMTCHREEYVETNTYSYDPDLIDNVLIPAFGNACY